MISLWDRTYASRRYHTYEPVHTYRHVLDSYDNYSCYILQSGGVLDTYGTTYIPTCMYSFYRIQSSIHTDVHYIQTYIHTLMVHRIQDVPYVPPRTYIQTCSTTGTSKERTYIQMYIHTDVHTVLDVHMVQNTCDRRDGIHTLVYILYRRT